MTNLKDLSETEHITNAVSKENEKLTQSITLNISELEDLLDKKLSSVMNIILKNIALYLKYDPFGYMNWVIIFLFFY